MVGYVEKLANDIEDKIDMDDMQDVLDLEVRLKKFFAPKGGKEPTSLQVQVLAKHYGLKGGMKRTEAEITKEYNYTSGDFVISHQRIRKNKAGRLYDSKTGRFVKKDYKDEYVA